MSLEDDVVMNPSSAYRRLVPTARLDTWVTPTEDVYVVAHMGIARVDLSRWRLRVDGLVDRTLTFAYRELTSLPSREVTAVLECFGNPLEADVPTRRVSNVVWEGIALSEVLAHAGVQAGADAVWLEGLDRGVFADVHSDRYRKDLPLSRVLQGDVLLAWRMNGAELTPEHGFPVRAFVPGYFGTNAVKWLTRVEVARGWPEGLYTTRLYNRRGRPVRELDVNSVIVSPADGAVLPLGSHTIRGWAWSARAVRRVEVSVDHSASWRDAHVAPQRLAHTWQRFQLDWPVDAPGDYEISCRATDALGRIQPFEGRNCVHQLGVSVS